MPSAGAVAELSRSSKKRVAGSAQPADCRRSSVALRSRMMAFVAKQAIAMLVAGAALAHARPRPDRSPERRRPSCRRRAACGNRKIGAWLKRSFGLSYSRSGLIAMLPDLETAAPPYAAGAATLGNYVSSVRDSNCEPLSDAIANFSQFGGRGGRRAVVVNRPT